jgi:predicted dehydrogenase/threonine dehydrogenase-like Zn-dependent dehydrogenase
MKQILESLRTGKVEVVDVPTPIVTHGSILVRNHFSLISAGTERMLLNFGNSSYVGKALQQPEKVKQVFQKIKTDGIATTLSAVQNKLDQPVPLGYSCVGEVIEVGKGVHSSFKIGDFVAGSGNHADIVCIPQNLCAKVPTGVKLEEASFVSVAAIALQGIRLAKPNIGECFVVTGLGLLGLFCVQILRANGCRVLGIDMDDGRLILAKKFGAEIVNIASGLDVQAHAKEFSRGRGVDGVIICAASKSSDMVNQAADMCRIRGRIIQVGVTGLNLSREKLFRKEIQLQVSNSAGPGKGDPVYEQQGIDYPVGFVRWTEQRNFEAVLGMMAERQLDTKSLISHQFEIEKVEAAYSVVGGSEPSMGIVLEYDFKGENNTRRLQESTMQLKEGNQYSKLDDVPSVAFIGSGNYATAKLIPAFKTGGADLYSIASKTGVSGVHAGKKFGFKETTTNTDQLFSDPNVDLLVVATRHDSHAQYVVKALEAEKHVFVEKPLAITMVELQNVQDAYQKAHENGNGNGPRLMVGFNRRFAPQILKMKELLSLVNEPKTFIMTMNAGQIPADHWIQDISIGGGRIVGEGCHYIDLMRYMADSEIESVQTRCFGKTAGGSITDDKATITLGFADGSFGTIFYLANGASNFPKERIEVFTGGRVLQLDNFRQLKGYGWPNFSKMNLWKQDKGQNNCAAAFLNAIVKAENTPINSNEIFEVARVSIEAAEMLRNQ